MEKSREVLSRGRDRSRISRSQVGRYASRDLAAYQAAEPVRRLRALGRADGVRVRPGRHSGPDIRDDDGQLGFQAYRTGPNNSHPGAHDRHDVPGMVEPEPQPQDHR